MKSLSILLLIIGLLLIISGYYKKIYKCPPTKIEYRYIPRNFYEEQNSETNLKSVYRDMFDNSSIWSKYPLGDVDISGEKKIKNFIDNYYN
tara:strand:- start:140 stop:412 length:273 start_codon:yes stop_codon:yes gene_type:complete